ncbi:DNA binding domain protein, excisionase family [uncultured Desulfatiglans sp.]|nr:DNA binding domain protein, excisionase family [uncultured Desulfatiglans sp.]
MSEHEWMKLGSVAEYVDASPRTVRKWLQRGLKHSRLPSGTVLVKKEWIDGFLEQFSITSDEADQIVRKMMEGL